MVSVDPDIKKQRENERMADILRKNFKDEAWLRRWRVKNKKT